MNDQTETPFLPGMHVQQTPMTIQVRRALRPDGQTVIVVHAEHATGSTMLVLDVDYARTVGNLLVRESGGLQIASTLMTP